MPARSRELVRDSNPVQNDFSRKRGLLVNVTEGFRHSWIQGLRVLVTTVSLCPWLVCPLVWPYSQPDFPEWRRSCPRAALHERPVETQHSPFQQQL